ncbi:MAG: hypothetical protein D8M57_06615 [Candidatus Scalindua sp. AMX11]|nr:MAG: hypothetical protein DWQ00_13780 [Candidatus Scalindua sp.]NOG85365.1 hypothetical protein [Planctomycetota bacterium]RZV83965.1 MAG: hypothetical protein EX341_08495 [Candidatus Scalindua sp. SCAELEC01]TDE65754.1 MAG: hypothetical protein D8M57_06615 [Candidatus Scalindua sp. AMX11]GJQ59639.1 MAG: hypothetical protein SCALA701_24400 [Candidatus Scalindua sp.]
MRCENKKLFWVKRSKFHIIFVVNLKPLNLGRNHLILTLQSFGAIKIGMNSVNIHNRLFTMPLFGVYFCKYATRVCFIIMCVICIAVKLGIGTSGTKYSNEIFLILPIMIVFVCVSDLLFRRFAYKICLDLDKSQVTFFMICPLIKEKIITVNIGEIEKVITKVPITFFVDGTKVHYNGSYNNELILFLKELKLVT